LLEYYGFVFFLPSYLAGPSCEMVEYQRYISKEMFNDKYCKGRVPSSAAPALWSLLRAFALVPLLLLQPQFPLNYFRTPEFLYGIGMLERILRLYVHCTLCRIKYYFAWYLSEGVFDACGIGYRLDGDVVKWDRFCNMDFLKVEMAPNVRSITTYWNTRTAEWLRHYVYSRVVPPNTKVVPMYATIITYTVSAFWHGFYPGYYTFFILTAFITEVAKDVRRYIRPLVIDDAKPNPTAQFLYTVVTTFTTSLFLNYGGSQFLLLDIWDGLTLCKSMYYFGHIVPVAALVFFRSPLRAILPRPKVAKKTE